MSADTDRRRQGLSLHLGIAEQGKLLALDGQHTLALAYYREAMRRAVDEKAPDVFFRHYMECALETLEHMGAFEDLLAYCDKAIAHYAEQPESEIALFDLATIHQRRGLVLLKAGRAEEARQALDLALETARATDRSLPLAATVSRWLAGQLAVSPERIFQEQKRREYFTVRADNVEPRRAVKLPGEMLAAAGPPHN